MFFRSSFGWYDESVSFEPIDTPRSTYREIDDWRDLNTWDAGRGAQQEKSEKVSELDTHAVAFVFCRLPCS